MERLSEKIGILRRVGSLSIVCCFLLIVSSVGFAELTFEPYLYEQDFEGSDPVNLWAANGSYTVNEIGITTNKAYSGAHAYVIDVTINSGSAVYWYIYQSAVPAEGALTLSGRVWAERLAGTTIRARLGVNAVMVPPTCYNLTDGASPSSYGEWSPVEYDVVLCARNLLDTQLQYMWGVTTNNVGVQIGKICFLIDGTPGERIRIYLDDIKLEGTVPTAASYAAEVSSRWALYADMFNAKLDGWEAKSAVAQTNIDNLPGDLSAFEQRLKAAAQARLDRIAATYDFETIRNGGWYTWVAPSLYDAIESCTFWDQADGIVSNIYLNRAGAITRTEHLLYNLDPVKTTFREVLPDADLIAARVKNEIYVTVTPGEYEAASFALKAYSNLASVAVAISNLTRNGGGTFASSNIDVRVVKCWYQNGIDRYWYVEGEKTLVPELLLKDDSLIDVNTTTSNNYVKLNGNYTLISDPAKIASVSPANDEFPVADSSALLPVNIASNQYKQFWLTVYAPTGTAAGEYAGDITLSTPSAGTIGKYKVKVNVLPFALEASPLTHSLYYCGQLTSGGAGTIGHVYKNAQQYSNELCDMFRHGVKNPAVYQDYTSDLALFQQALAARTNAGMNGSSLYYLGLGTGSASDSNALAVLKSKVTNVCAVAANYGITNVYIYGNDEAQDDGLLMQREAWEAVHEAGAKVFSAGHHDCLALEYPYGKRAYWHLDEGAGEIAADSTAYACTAALHGSPVWTTSGVVSNALIFDGVDDYVDCGSNAILHVASGSQAFTFEAWMYPTTTATTNTQCVMGKIGYDMGLFWYNGTIIFAVYDSNNNYRYMSSGNKSAGNWYHVVGSFDGSSMRLFVNGAPAGNWFLFGALRDYPAQTYIGAPLSSASFFQGAIDEVRIYNRWMRTEEVVKNYQDGVNGKRTTVADLKDLHVNCYIFESDAALAHAAGHRIYSYASPHSGEENPEVYRRSDGLYLGRLDFDGNMEWAYQAGVGHIWNDFDNSGYRDGNFTYPTTNGVIDTIAWEGYSEGVDDTRYMATLEKTIDEAPASAEKNDAIAFVDNLKETYCLGDADLTGIRSETIDHILKLTSRWLAMPTVIITNPAGSEVCNSFTINALAGCSNGTIDRVEFYNGSALLGSDQTEPYSCSLTNATGAYTLTARVYAHNQSYNPVSTSAVSAAVAVSAYGAGAIIRVAPNGNDANNGSSWPLAKATIQAAVNAAGNGVGDTVLVTNGVYTLTAPISITKGVRVTSVNGRDFTFVNGNYPAVTNRAFYINNAGALVDGFTITNARTSGSDRGAGVNVYYYGTISNCTISDCRTASGGMAGGVYLQYGGKAVSCVISNNSCGSYGGGVYVSGSSAVMDNCEVVSNSAQYGGGVVNYNGIVTNCTIRDNWITGGALYYYGGGGVYLEADVGAGAAGGVIANCRIIGNRLLTSQTGAGIYIYGGKALGCLIAGNSGGYGGGGVCMRGTGGGVLENCDVFSNVVSDTSGWGGGGVYLDSSVNTMRNCRVVGNLSSANGGGVKFNSASVIQNSLIAGNYGGLYGGGIYFNGVGSLKSCTIASNYAVRVGGGVYCKSGSSLTNCIVYFNNSGYVSGNNFTNNAGGSWGYSCAIGDASTPNPTGPGIVTNAPAFVSPAGGDFHLSVSSPCINAGTNELSWMTGAKDLDGVNNRIIDSITDMGCFEYNP